MDVQEVKNSAGGEREFPLTPMQEGMLFHYLSEPGSGVDMEQIVGSLHHPVDVARLRAAWERAARLVPRLGASFRWVGVSHPLQREGAVVPPLEVRDLSAFSPDEREARVASFLEEDRTRPFRLDAPPLLRLTLFRMGEEEYRLVWTFPHIVMDGRSFPIVLRQVFRHYDGPAGTENGVAPATTIPSDALSYTDFVRWHGERDTRGEEAFWKGYLEDYPGPTSVLAGGPSPTGPVSTSGGSDGGAPSRGPRRETSLRLSSLETQRLRALAEAAGVSLNTVIQGAWSMLLSRYSGEEEVAFGAVRACRRWGAEDAGEMVGMFINTLPVRTRVVGSQELKAWLTELSRDQRSLRPHEHTPLIRLQQWSGVPQGTPLFESLLIYDHAHLGTTLKEEGGPWERRDFELLERTTYPVTLYAYGEEALLLKLAHDLDRLPAGAADRLLGHLGHLLREMGACPESRLEELEILPPDQRRRLLHGWNDTAREIPLGSTLHGVVAEGLAGDASRSAVVCGEAELSAGGLEELSNRMAHHLRARGVSPGDLVGVALPRSVDMVVALLGVLKAGAAYLPLDPEYPAERLSFMVEDSGMKAVIATRDTVAALGVPVGSGGGGGVQGGVQVVLLDRDRDALLRASGEEPPDLRVDPEALAYVIYTSGSTGRPKGVQVEHRNVVNFLMGMDDVLSGGPEEGAWLSLTSFSFDISVLEIFWTLSRGLTLVLHRDEAPGKGSLPAPFLLGETPAQQPAMELSLFYFASDSGQDPENRYRLLLEGARFADREGFSAIWTPERHFHAFGGLYPNPAVAGAAVAAITTNVGIRAGSVVLPLHHPVRVAEEWSMVDNLSGGRVGVSVAAGWHPDDFLLAPENHAERKEVMFRNIDVVQRLWRGERLSFPGPQGGEVEVGIMPRPIQQELPIWVTTAGSVDTYREAGTRGLRILTHLLGQTVEELGEKIAAYREAWDEAGHPAGGGHVSLMLHTFVGEDDESVREVVREPMKDYLRTSVGLIKNFASSWTAYRRKSGKAPVAQGDEFAQLSAEDMDALLEFSFNRYFEGSGLFGSRETCLRMARRLRASGVSEIACLIDFGVETNRVLEHLPLLAAVRRELSREEEAPTADPSFALRIREEGVTHIQCTPSQLRILLADPESREALQGVPLFLVGGEAFPGSLARELREATGGRVLNMYGPTETTIWSSFLEVTEEEAPEDGVIPIGRPIANTRLYVLDQGLRPVPVGVAGELFIGGLGVARGYLDRPELSRQRFLPDPFGGESFGGEEGARMYRTGDRVRHREDGVLEFLGRTDHQVKLRGHRIETGEIEAVLQGHPAVAHAAVVLREDVPGDQRLAAYLVPSHGAPGDDALVAEVKGHLAGVLPAIMVPSSFTLLEELPLTPNRKVDRKALPSPSRASGRKAKGVETSPSPAGAAGEQPGARGNGHAGPPDARVAGKVSEIWKDLLGLEEVSLDDNFFDLGGHSLLTVQVHGRIREAFQQELRITDLFRYPTIRTLSHFLAREGEEEEMPEPVTSALDRGALRRQALRRRTRGGSEG